MDAQKQQIADRIKQANNILVTVSANPSVDQLSACIGMALALNKLKKHATAVFSGTIPSTIEFLQPEKTLEKTTDSLRDFIIALDKSKADKLRYKIEDKVVKIFITPYRTSIGEKDLQFSEGDFNVDVVVALGVHNQADLDQAITAHGRILHDATVMAINVKPGGELGSVNLVDPAASSLSELAVELLDILDKRLIDNQIATSLLTGIVAETERFRNTKTTPKTMSISAELLSAGANQQLVAAKLEAPPPPPPPISRTPASQGTAGGGQQTPPSSKPDDGTLEIQHDDVAVLPEYREEPRSEPQPPKVPPAPQIHIDDEGEVHPLGEKPSEPFLPPPPPPPRMHTEGPHLVLQPPRFDSQLTANGNPTSFAGGGDALTLPQIEEPSPLLDREPLQAPSSQPSFSSIVNPDANVILPTNAPSLTLPTPPPPNNVPPPPPPPAPTPPPPPPVFAAAPPIVQAPPPPAATPEETLSDIERDVHSTHVDTPPPPPAFSSPPPNNVPPPPPPPAPTPPPPPPVFAAAPPIVQAPPTATLNTPDVSNARDAVSQALNGDPNAPVEPMRSLNAQELGAPLRNDAAAPVGAGLPADLGPILPPVMPQDDVPEEGLNGGPGVLPPPPVPPPMIPPMPTYNT
jgi:hypothetical protein